MSEPTGLPWEIRLVLWISRWMMVPWLHLAVMVISSALAVCAWRAGEVEWLMVAAIAAVSFAIMGAVSVCVRRVMRDG